MSTDIDLAVDLLDKWSGEGIADEKCWFIARYVLLKLASERVQEARAVFTYYASQDLYVNSRPLHQFLKYLFKAIELKSSEIFVEVEIKFKGFILKDSDFITLLDRIGQTYFGIVKERQPSMIEMMSRMMGM